MLTIATYFWFDPAWKHNGRFTYQPDDVRLLQRMVARNMTGDYEFAVITDRPHLFDDDPAIKAIPLDMATHVPGKCYCRLMTFHPNGQELLGTDRIAVMDLDVVVTGDMTPLFDRPEELVLWRNPARVPWDSPRPDGGAAKRCLYNTSILMHRPGTMPEIWEQFDRDNIIVRDDQWWLSYLLGAEMPYWDGSDGIYRIGRADTPGSGVNDELPDNARIVFFPGSEGKPWEPEIAERCKWIPSHRY